MKKEGRIYGLDLFSGIGGISLALEPWVKTVAYCEQDQFCQGVLLSKMSEGKLDRAPIWDDVRTLKAGLLPDINIIFGGFPCQDLSVAGARKGLDGDRSRLFFEIIRLTKEIRPTFVFLENVPGIRTRGLRQVIGAFAEVGYDCRWTCISASSVGAPHKRERWLLLAHAHRNLLRVPAESERKEETFSTYDGNKELMASTSESGPEGISQRQAKNIFSSEGGWWKTEPDVVRVVDGIPFRVDRIKSLGNSVVPLQIREGFKLLLGKSEQTT